MGRDMQRRRITPIDEEVQVGEGRVRVRDREWRFGGADWAEEMSRVRSYVNVA